MNLLIVHRYFWPQNYPYALMLKEIAEVAATDHTVQIVTTEQTDSDEKARRSWTADTGITIHALKLPAERQATIARKTINAGLYACWLFFRLLFSRADVVMIATTPPVVGAFIVRVASRIKKFRYIYHLQDIHPEAMYLNGTIASGMLYRFLIRLDRNNVEAAAKLVVLSSDMRDTLKERECGVENVHIINNFILDMPRDQPGSNSRPFRFLFAGNLGRFQNLELLVRGIAIFNEGAVTGTTFTFLGDGALRKPLERLAADFKAENIEFLGQKSFSEATALMRDSDFGVVTLAPGLVGVAYPSKTITYLSNGLPIFGIMDEGSEIFEYINNFRLGVAVDAETPENIAEAIKDAITLHGKGTFDKDHIIQEAQRSFGQSVILSKWRELFSGEDQWVHQNRLS